MANIITKKKLINSLANTKISKQKSTAAINTILIAIANSLANSQGVEIRGFGSFKVKTTKTMNKVKIHYKPSKIINHKLNK